MYREKVSQGEKICPTQETKKRTNCTSDTSFYQKLAFGTRVFAKNVKSVAESNFKITFLR